MKIDAIQDRARQIAELTALGRHEEAGVWADALVWDYVLAVSRGQIAFPQSAATLIIAALGERKKGA